MYREVTRGSKEAESLWQLWDSCVGEDGFPYKRLTPEEFDRLFFEPKAGTRHVTLIHESGRAFSSGSYIEGEERGFVTMVLVSAAARGSGLGSEMLEALEKEMKARFRVKTMHILFFNPVNLVWEIPGHPGCVHPNSPGVDLSSAAYLFFKARGYRDYAKENSYFMELGGYEPPQAIRDAEARLNADGYFIKVYDPDTMYGMEEMINGLGNSMWQEAILGEPAPKDGGRPILVPVKDGRVLGFTGPLDVEPNGRGFFAGIAVDPAARGRGVAKVLFAALCSNLRAIGADYMTLFTGEENPARNIYEAAGFVIVKSWANMKKEMEG